MTESRAGRVGPALIALIVIVAITAAWWALALWPAGTAAPEWLVRTRAACFGAAPGGLPDAGGWVLLIGEPAGMLAVLLAVWGGSLKADIARVHATRPGRAALNASVLLGIASVAVLAGRVQRSYARVHTPVTTMRGRQSRLNVVPPSVELVDQRGERVVFSDFHGRPALLTFGYGHCATVCPTIVMDLLSARRSAKRADTRLIVVTLDPWRDTPDRLATLASHWSLEGDDRVLSGSVGNVESALNALGVGRRRNETTGDIDHAGTVMYLDAAGTLLWRLDGGWAGVSNLLTSSARAGESR